MTCEWCNGTGFLYGNQQAPCRACAPDAPYLSGLTESDVCKGVECRHPSHGTDAPDGFEAEVFALRGEVLGLRRALEEISKGAGPYSRDQLEHATNTIETMKAAARAALLGGGEKP
jgi:hypothetical protein